MSCELEAFENCFMTFPVGSDDDDSSEWKYQNDVPVIVLLGWTGCQQRHLKKYSAIYEKKCITMRYIAPVEDSFFRLKKVRSAAGKILQLIIDHKLHEHPILVHTFSNGGCRVYRYLSDLVHNSKAFSSITLSGVIFDSCPSRLHINRGVQVYMSVCNRSLVVKYFLAACLFICFLMLTVFPRCAQWISSSWVLVDDFWAFMWKDPASCPHLYLYSVKDSLVPYGEVEEMIAERRCRGVHVQTQCWDDSEHVAHFVAHRETYMTACLEFLQLCTSHTV